MSKSFTRRNKGLLAILLVIGVFFGTVVSLSGWQTEGLITSAGTTGINYDGGSQVTSVSAASTQYLIGGWDSKTIVIQSNHGVLKNYGYVDCPQGPANVKISTGNIYHVQPTGRMIQNIPEVGYTDNDAAYVRELMLIDPNHATKVYYFYEFYYAIDIDFRTLATVMNNDECKAFDVHVHEGNVAGSFGTDVNAWVYLNVTIDKNWIFKLLPNYQNATFDGGVMQYTDAFVGIMNAWYYVGSSGYTSDMPNVNTQKEQSYPGHVNGAPVPGSGLTLTTGSTPGYSAGSLTFHRQTDFPTSVLLKAYSGNMLAGGYFQSQNWGGFLWLTDWQRSWGQPIDVYSKETVVIDVLASAGYTIITGNPPATNEDADFNPIKTAPSYSTYALWALILIFGFAIVWKVLPAVLPAWISKKKRN